MLSQEQNNQSHLLINDVLDATPWWNLPDNHLRYVTRYIHHGLRDAALYDLALSYVPGIIPSGVTREELHAGATLHDTGKPYVMDGDETLWDRSMLDDQDWAKIRKHPEVGLAIVSAAVHKRALRMGPEALAIIGMHHELLDGSGYPDGLMAAQIPLYIQLFSVIDHAVSLREGSDVRPYRTGRTRFEDIALYLSQLADVGKLNGNYVQLVLTVLRRNEHLEKSSLWTLGRWADH